MERAQKAKKNNREPELFPDEKQPEQPEAFRLYHLCRRYNRLWLAGEIADQPHMMMMEWDICAAAQQEYADLAAKSEGK